MQQGSSQPWPAAQPWPARSQLREARASSRAMARPISPPLYPFELVAMARALDGATRSFAATGFEGGRPSAPTRSPAATARSITARASMQAPKLSDGEVRPAVLFRVEPLAGKIGGLRDRPACCCAVRQAASSISVRKIEEVWWVGRDKAAIGGPIALQDLIFDKAKLSRSIIKPDGGRRE